MSDDDSFADGIRELLRNHNLSSSSFIRCVTPVARIDHESSNRSVFLNAAFVRPMLWPAHLTHALVTPAKKTLSRALEQ
jgi:hypothetical protein